MRPEIVVALIMGGSGLLSAGWTLYVAIRDRKNLKQKQSGEILLNREQQRHIAAEAAKINSDERIATERWWKEQFDAVKAELVKERQGRARIVRSIRQHQPWDQMVQQKLAELGLHVSHPPALDLLLDEEFDQLPETG